MVPLVLTFMSGPRDGEVVTLDGDRASGGVTIGRSPRNTVTIPDDPEASREHVRLTRRGEDWWLEDLGSANGTFLGEFKSSVRIAAPTKLSPGDIFKVGLTRFRFGPSRLGLSVQAQESDAATTS